MSICFCGCGVQIGVLKTGRRSANKMGQIVKDALGEIERDVQPHLPTSGESNVLLDAIARSVKEGGWFERDCRHVVHEEHEFGDIAWPAMREWVYDARDRAAYYRNSPAGRARAAHFELGVR